LLNDKIIYAPFLEQGTLLEMVTVAKSNVSRDYYNHIKLLHFLLCNPLCNPINNQSCSTFDLTLNYANSLMK